MGGQRHAAAALTRGKDRYLLYRRLGGPQGRSGRVRKISSPTGIRSLDRPSHGESPYRLRYLGLFRNVRVYLPHVIFQKTWLRNNSFLSGLPTKILCTSNIFQKVALLRDLPLNSVYTTRLSIHATISVGCNNL